MASSTRGGKRGSKRKKINLTPSKTGAYIYQSDRARKSMKESASRDELDDLIDKAYSKRMHSGELTPEEAGTKSASTTIDRIHDSHFEGPDYEKPRKMKYGGKVPSKYKGFSKLPENVQRQMDSGLAEKYEYGGKVGGCRGGGAAIAGTKFSGCK